MRPSLTDHDHTVFLILSHRFRWVYCQLEALRPCFPNNLRRMLEELPKSLDETYQRILKEINNANHKQAHQLLQCLAVAQRPLRVEELAEVLALDVDAGGIPTFNANWRWQDHEAAVLSACSSLVSVIIDDGFRVVQFSHFSVKEFLTSDRLASMEDVSQFYISDEPSHAILAQACLSVILRVYDPTSEDSVEDIALLEYAGTYWDDHVLFGKVELRIQDALDCLFDVDRPHFEAFMRRLVSVNFSRHFRVPSDQDPKGVLSPAAPFILAREAGFGGLAERVLVSNQPQVIGFRLQGWTLLHLMVEREQIESARLLLVYGADINSRPDYATPPHIASLQRHVERPADGSFEEIEEIENSLQNSDADVSSEESPDDSLLRYERKSGFTPLHIAVKRGYLDMCQMLLEHNPDVHATDNEGNTPLHLALLDINLEISRVLLEYNAEVNSRNEDGSTPLLIASSNGNIGLFRLLLAHNADVFVHDNWGNTPLHLAAFGGHLEVVRDLLELEADVDSLNGEGLTPSQQALKGQREGYLDIVCLLLNHGADEKVHDENENTPLHFAASEGHLEVARMLLEHKVDVDSLNSEGLTPLQRASKGRREGYLDIMRLLLDYGANVNVHDENENTPLHFAASEGHLEVARMLLDRKADVDSLNGEGLTPLHRASIGRREGCLDIVRLLLYHGANVNVHDNDRNTPLHFAASYGHLEVVRMLLERKANVYSLNSEGLTPLLRASRGWREGYLDIIQLLLDYGANVNAHDNNRNTPLHFAASYGHLEFARVLLEHKADVNTLNKDGLSSLHRTFKRGRGDIVRLLLNHGADAKGHDERGNTLLHLAALTGDLELARISLKRIADTINSHNDDGLTALPLALKRENLDVARLLLEHNADVHVRDKRGNTPLHVAAFTGNGHLDICRILLERNAEVNSRNHHGSTPLLLASERGPELVQLFLDHNADPRARDGDGDTLLHCAALAGRLKVVRLLLERNADLNVEVNSRNNKGSTPLHLASAGYHEGDPDIVRLLLDHDADSQARNLSGKTASEVARGRREREIVQLLSLHGAE